MTLTIRNENGEDLTVKPYRILVSSKYWVKPVLYPSVISIGKQSERVEIFFKIPATYVAAIDYLKSLTSAVEVVNSDHDEIPLGTYGVEAVEMKHETGNLNVIDVRLSMFRGTIYTAKK